MSHRFLHSFSISHFSKHSSVNLETILKLFPVAHSSITYLKTDSTYSVVEFVSDKSETDNLKWKLIEEKCEIHGTITNLTDNQTQQIQHNETDLNRLNDLKLEIKQTIAPAVYDAMFGSFWRRLFPDKSQQYPQDIKFNKEIKREFRFIVVSATFETLCESLVSNCRTLFKSK